MKETRAVFSENQDFLDDGGEALLDAAVRGGANTVVPLVFRHGRGATWDSNVAEHVDSDYALDDMMCWREHYKLDIVPCLHVAAARNAVCRPHWVVDPPAGGALAPAYDIHNPLWRRWFVSLVREVSERFSCDVALDYVRSMHYELSPDSQAQYAATYGYEYADDLERLGAGGDSQWRIRNFNGNALRQLLRDSRVAIPGRRVSVFSHIGREDWLDQGANAVAWLNEGLVDVCWAMEYGNEFSDDLQSAYHATKEPERIFPFVASATWGPTKPTEPVPAITLQRRVEAAQVWNRLGHGIYKYELMNEEQRERLVEYSYNQVRGRVDGPWWPC